MIPREIDDLMWTIAEGTDHSAIEEFGDRYPNLREELLKRIRTVNALKAGNRLPRTTSVPTFQNTQVRPANWRIIWTTFGVAVLSVLAFGVYKLTVHPGPVPDIPAVNLEPVIPPDANIQFSQSNEPRPQILQPTYPQQNNSPSGQGTRNSPPPVVGKLSTVKLESAPLHAAIMMIAEEGHWVVTIAKGTPNPTVKIDFQNMLPMDMLKELGQQYAFTPVLDGDHAILIIPKKDEDEGQIISGNG